jgi:hypothetical protein
MTSFSASTAAAFWENFRGRGVLCRNASFRYGMYSWRKSRSERRAQTPVVVLDAHPARVAAKAIKTKKDNWRIGFYARVMVNLQLLCSLRREA